MLDWLGIFWWVGERKSRIRMVDLPRADPDYYGRLLRMHNTFLEKIQVRTILISLDLIFFKAILT